MGYDFSVGDHLHPVTGLLDEVADRVESVFAEKMLYEKYTEGARYVSEVAILVPETDYRAPEYLKGAARMLCELKIPYSVYNSSDDFSREKLLILPRALEITDELKDKISAFRASGGKLLFIGEGSDMAEALGAADGITELSRDTSDNAFFLTEDGNMQWAIYKPARLFKSRAKELAKYVSGYFNFVYDGLHSYFYRPQNEITDYSAAVVTDGVGYICYDAFEAYASNFLRENKLLVGKVIDALLPERMIESKDLPSTAVVSVTKNEKHSILHVKVTYPSIRNGRGIVEEHNFLDRATVSLRGEYRVTAIPSEKPVPVTYEGGRTVVTLENIKGYGAFLLEEK
jgi:hypothetical protein